jgi:BirA family biotin operon repressor/biotin-[acetyl-CoA-carboxylase] ligase
MPEIENSFINSDVRYYDRLDSSNKEAWRLIEQGAGEGLVIIAKEQTAGRGQWGRTWQSSLGGLYLSIVLQPSQQREIAAHLATQITIFTAWGIAKALREAIAPDNVPGKFNHSNNSLQVNIKWPNDLIINGQKLGGILTETKVSQGLVKYAVVGIGINWLNPVPEHGIALGYLNTAIANLDSLTKIVRSGVLAGYEHFAKYGMTQILSEYLDLLGDRQIQWQGKIGTIQKVRQTGELVVQWQDQPDLCVYKPGMISLGYIQGRQVSDRLTN